MPTHYGADSPSAAGELGNLSPGMMAAVDIAAQLANAGATRGVDGSPFGLVRRTIGWYPTMSPWVDALAIDN